MGEAFVHKFMWKMDVVVHLVVDALKVRQTPPEVVVGSDARFLWAPFRMLPASVRGYLASAGPSGPVPAAMQGA